jgi:hypothetical protein
LHAESGSDDQIEHEDDENDYKKSPGKLLAATK